LEQYSEDDLPKKLKLHAAYYFGSPGKAKAALKTDRRFGAGWSTTKIIAGIRQRRRLGKPLGYPAAQRDNPALVSAAEAYFGSWGNALVATGIDPNLYLTVSGGDEECPLKEMVLAMAKYLTRPCPRCNGYLGIVLREAGGNTPLQASNGR
jgi:hypothetical protein